MLHKCKGGGGKLELVISLHELAVVLSPGPLLYRDFNTVSQIVTSFFLLFLFFCSVRTLRA